jgi:hypothetical protein
MADVGKGGRFFGRTELGKPEFGRESGATAICGQML